MKEYRVHSFLVGEDCLEEIERTKNEEFAIELYKKYKEIYKGMEDLFTIHIQAREISDWTPCEVLEIEEMDRDGKVTGSYSVVNPTEGGSQ